MEDKPYVQTSYLAKVLIGVIGAILCLLITAILALRGDLAEVRERLSVVETLIR